MQPLQALGRLWKQVSMAWVDVEMVLDLLDEDSIIKEIENPVKANFTGGEIEFKNVCFTYDFNKQKQDQR